MKRILLVKPVLPYPPDQGTKVVSFGMIEALCASYDVTVLARLLERSEEVHVRSLEKTGARVVTVLPANRTSVVARIAYKAGYATRSVLTGRSLKSLYDCPGATIRAARALAREPFDWFIVEYWQMYPLLDVFPRARTALLTHDIDMLVSGERARFDRDLVSRAKALTTWRVEAREEKRAYQRAGRVWTLTQRDADTVAAVAGRKAEVMPVGLGAEFFVDDPAPRDSREVLLMGAMHSPFNRDAIDHFVEDIHPALSSIPGVRFTVGGGGLRADCQRRAHGARARHPALPPARRVSGGPAPLRRRDSDPDPLCDGGGVARRVLAGGGGGHGLRGGAPRPRRRVPGRVPPSHRAPPRRPGLCPGGRAGRSGSSLARPWARNARGRPMRLRAGGDGGKCIVTPQNAS
jgi:hypothetical protein